jgi:hypothetical protein
MLLAVLVQLVLIFLTLGVPAAAAAGVQAIQTAALAALVTVMAQVAVEERKMVVQERRNSPGALAKVA